GFTVHELARENSHADQIAAVNAFETFRNRRANAEQARAFSRPITRRAGAILLASDHDQRNSRLAIFHRGVVNRHLFAARLIRGPAAFGAGSELIFQTNVGKGSAHHYFMIAAASAVGVEVVWFYAIRDEVFSRGRIHSDRTRR